MLPRTAEALAQQLEIFARGAGRLLGPAERAETAERCAPWLAGGPAASLVFAEVAATARAELTAWAEALLESAPHAMRRLSVVSRRGGSVGSLSSTSCR